MGNRLRSPVLLLLLAIGVVGLVDALIGNAYDLAVLFGATAVLAVAGLTADRGRRRPVRLRADLAAALRDRGLRTGESDDQLLDRAVATYLDALSEPEPTAP
jgi:hypothetical protein